MIVLSKHARERLEEQNLSTAWVEETIRQPDRTEPDTIDPALTRSFRAVPELHGRVLQVVHRRHGHDLIRW